MSDQPKCLEVTVNASTGGKVTIVKFDLSSDYHFSQTARYSIPEDWSQEQVDKFVAEESLRLYEQVDGVAQPVLEDLMDQSMVFRNGEYTGG